ncbi:MAG: endonuclease/exonuclease/phosphatase family protein [Acidobacteriota bacterium]
MSRLRIATYNIHKCVGIDRRYSPERIGDVLEEIDADVVALQEVLCRSLTHRRDNQADYLADRLSMDFRLGENRRIKGGEYGNAVLSRFAIGETVNYDITVKHYEPRGCLRTEISIEGRSPLQFVNVHMGTSFFERRLQIHKLLSVHALDPLKFAGHRIVAGDFNEWTRGLTSRLLGSHFNSIDPKMHLGRARTFPGIMPLVHLDHIYFDHGFRLVKAYLHRSRTALLASDHLPIVAELEY